LHRSADVVICFENDKMGEAVPAKAGIQEAFAVSDGTIAQSIRALVAMAHRRGPVHAGLDEIATTVHGLKARSLFGFGIAEGDNRAHEALEMALKNPLLDRGRRFRDADSAVVQVAGGPDLTLDEVRILMEEVHRHLPERTRLFFGAEVDPALGGRLAVTIVSAVPSELPGAAAPERKVERAEESATREPELDLGDDADEEEYAETEVESDGSNEDEEQMDVPVARPVAAQSQPQSKGRPLFAVLRPQRDVPLPGTAKEQKAEQMQFEPVNRGRFEKSEPTIIDGQDLDVPTFLRRTAKPK
jgi:cell division protein FtsZ